MSSIKNKIIAIFEDIRGNNPFRPMKDGVVCYKKNGFFANESDDFKTVTIGREANGKVLWKVSLKKGFFLDTLLFDNIDEQLFEAI